MPDGGFEVTIGMAATTVAALSQRRSWLYALHAVEASDGAMLPVVWLQSLQYSETTLVSWPGERAAYTSPGPDSIAPGAKIVAGFSAPICAGQVLSVEQTSGTGQVTAPGPVANAIAVLNRTTAPLATGLAQELNGSFRPICAAPLYGQSVELIVPLDQVLLAFSSVPAPPGTVVTSLYGSSGVLLDLYGVSSRTVQFDINRGWSWGGATWGQTVGASENLAPLLVRRSEALSRAARVAAASI